MSTTYQIVFIIISQIELLITFNSNQIQQIAKQSKRKGSRMSSSKADSFCLAQLYESDFDLDTKKICQEIENEGVILVRIGEETNLNQVVVHNPIHAKW